MLRAFLFPILVAMSVTLIHLVSSRSRGMPPGEHPVFRISKGLRIFLWVGVVAGSAGLMRLVFDIPSSQRTSSFLMTGGIAIFGCVCCLYADKYVVTFWDDHLTYGAFKMSSIYYRDIISAEARSGGQGTTFLFVKTSKKTVSINGFLSSFDDAVRLLKSKLTDPGRS